MMLYRLAAPYIATSRRDLRDEQYKGKFVSSSFDLYSAYWAIIKKISAPNLQRETYRITA